jgi:hypothetical protein
MSDFVCLKIDESLSPDKIISSVRKLIGSGTDGDSLLVVSIKRISITDESFVVGSIPSAFPNT